MIDRICALEECDQPIPEGARQYQVYCSPQHGQLASNRRRAMRRPAFRRRCLYCGKEFETTKESKVYCSPACAQLALSERRRQARLSVRVEVSGASEEDVWDAVSGAARVQRQIMEPPSQVEARIDTAVPVAVVFVSDMHLGSEGVDYDQLRADLDIMQNLPGLYVIMGGDSMDMFIKESHLGAMKTMAVGPALQMKLYETILGSLKDKIIAVGVGQHEDWIQHMTGLDWVKELADRKRLAYTGHGALIVLTVGGQQYRIFRRHKLRFWSSFNRTHALKRMWEFSNVDFDIGVGEDKHQAALEPFVRHGKDKLAMMVGTYKTFDRFAQERGFYGMKAQCPAVVLYPDEWRMVGFVDFYDAIEHLRPWYP